MDQGFIQTELYTDNIQADPEQMADAIAAQICLGVQGFGACDAQS